MEVKLFQKIQRHLAFSINEVIDKYWQDEIEEPEMINLIQNLYTINKATMMKDGQYTTIIRFLVLYCFSIGNIRSFNKLCYNSINN